MVFVAVLWSGPAGVQDGFGGRRGGEDRERHDDDHERRAERARQIEQVVGVGELDAEAVCGR